MTPGYAVVSAIFKHSKLGRQTVRNRSPQRQILVCWEPGERRGSLVRASDEATKPTVTAGVRSREVSAGEVEAGGDKESFC